MFKFLILQKNFYNYYGFDSNFLPCIDKIILNSGNSTIYNCQFFNLKSTTSHGGVIYCSNININLLINTCFFNNCSTTFKNGGAIFFSSTVGASVINNICANTCFTGANSNDHLEGGQFCWIVTSKSKINEIHFLSTYKCAFDSINVLRHNSIYIGSGKQKYSNSNSSNNHAGYRGGIYFSESEGTYSNFNNFNNPNHKFGICIYSLNSKNNLYLKDRKSVV